MIAICKIVGAFGVNCTSEKPRFESVYEDFLKHIEVFGNSYGTHEEHNFRFNLYSKADARINEMNAETNSWVAGHNQFSTWTQDEYKKMLGKKQMLNNLSKKGAAQELDTLNLPTSVDWREKGGVNPIQDQGQCGSCWAFSSIASMEGAHFIKTGQLIKLAEEQLKDCDMTCMGCDGGDEEMAFQYAETNKIDLESKYPYKPQD